MSQPTLSTAAPFRRFAIVTALLALAVGVGGAVGVLAQDAAKPGAAAQPLKIVLHVSDNDHWMPVFSNLKNLTAQHPEAKLRVIIDGTAVYALQGTTDMSPMFHRFSVAGVEFDACNNALGEKQIATSALPSYIKVVPAAVIALAESQYQGYAYVKP